MLSDVTPAVSPSRGAYARLMTACGGLAALLFGALGTLVCLDVFLRNLGVLNLTWGLEVSEYLLMTAAFVAAPWLLYHGDHIRVDILVRALPSGAQRGLDALSNLFGLGVCALLAWEAAGSARDAAAQGALTYKVLVFPEWWLTTPMIASFALMTVEFARRLVRPAPVGGR
ncbi:TRAP transporter small permease [Achromobacter sp. GG226]|uniref:TRAP transporter small permease n=1 Tax=Verticiella alkaliphila TaxID=2779529 RepID=UPI001C0E30EF|nr:TRAP transporter small permease [Verticiella sp. GG226]MBU4610918.1 TRAP transporter small permease [Verticiella sp. GG226]